MSKHRGFMKRNLYITAGVLLCLGATQHSMAMTGEEALKKFQNRMYGIDTMAGNITWMYHSGQSYTGTFKYMSPGKIHVKFTSPSGRVLATNGKRLWVYDSSSNICGVQDVGMGGSGGIAGLVNGYLAILTAQGPSGYTLKLKNSEKTYSEIILVLDGSFMLKKAVLNSKDGEGMTVTLTNVRTGVSMIPGMFDFNVPSNAQVVKNPLNVK